MTAAVIHEDWLRRENVLVTWKTVLCLGLRYSEDQENEVERPWKHCFRAVYQVLDHLGYKLYVIISLFRILCRKKYSIRHLLFKTCPYKLELMNFFFFFKRKLIVLPDLRGCFLIAWIIRANFSSTGVEWTNNYSSWMNSQEKDGLKH